MKQIRASKNTPNGIVVVLMRFIGKYIFIKNKKNSPESINLIKQYRQKGIKIWESREWLKIDLFGENNVAKFGDEEVDLEKMNLEEVETFISKFYAESYKKGGFIVEIHGITT